MILVSIEALFGLLRRLPEWAPVEGGDLIAQEDYFWSIPQEQLFSSAAPMGLTLGQLFDSAEFTRNALHGDYIVPYNAAWVADILDGVVNGVVTSSNGAGESHLHLSVNELMEAGVGALAEVADYFGLNSEIALPEGRFWTTAPAETYNALAQPSTFGQEEVSKSVSLIYRDAAASRISDAGAGALADVLDIIGRTPRCHAQNL